MMNLSQFLPAMEADDITTDVEKETSKVLGNKPEENNDDSDNMKTDNIFGSSNDGEGSSDENLDDNNDVNSDDNLEDDNLDDTPSEPDDQSGDGLDDTTSEDPADEPNEVEKKKKLMNNMVLMYNVICNNIELLSDYSSSTSLTDDSSKVLYNISGNLNDCKSILYKEITKNFSQKDYVVLLKTYVGIARVYDLCTEMLNKHFDNLELQGRSTHIRHPRKKTNVSKKDEK